MAVRLAPAAIVIVGLLLVPLATLLRYSFNRYSTQQLMVATFTWENYARFFAEPYYREVMFTTLGLSLACVLGSLLLGFPVAYWLARTKSRWKSIIVIAILFPLLVGNVVRAAGWMAFLGRQGFLNVSLQHLGIIGEPLQLMFTPWAVLVGMLGVLLPFMILTLQGVLESIDFTLMDAAANLGAKPATAFREIVLPLASRGMAAGSALVFTVAMNSYATPYLLGGPGFKMMAPTIYKQIAVGANWPFGAALSFLLIALTMAVTLSGTHLLAREYKSA